MSKKQKSAEEFRVLIVYPNLTAMLVPSLAIALFTRILKAQGYIVDLFDTTHYVSDENSSPQNRVKFLQARKFDEKDDLGVRWRTNLLTDFRKKVEDFKPDLMLFSVVEDCFRQCTALLEAVEDLKIPHLVGGVFPTAAPQVCIEHKNINCIGIGEGEDLIVHVSEAIRKNESLLEIPGTWHRLETGEIVKNKRSELVNISKWTPDFSLFDETRFHRPMGGRIFKTIPVETYRGCPFSCTYCNSPMQNTLAKADKIAPSYLRKKDFKQLRLEIKDLIERFSPEFLYFIDDSFTARPKNEVYEFCDMYEEFKLPFWFNTRPETCTADMLKRLKEVGAYRISYGIESGNEQFRRKVLLRNTSNEKLKDLFEEIHSSGIAFSVNLIIGFPGETRDLVMDTVQFVRSIKGFDTITCSIFTPYHGTVLREVAVRNGWLDRDYITKHTTSSSCLHMPPPYMSSGDIDGLMRTIPLLCYFPESEWDNLRRAEIDDEEGNKLLKHYSDLYKKNFLKSSQDEEKTFILDGASGCKSNPLDSFQISRTPDRFTSDEIDKLTIDKFSIVQS